MSGGGELRVVAAALLDARGWLLAAQRAAGRRQAGLWELPGGKVEPGESDEDALRREIGEELGVWIEVEERLAECAHAYPDQVVRLVAYRCWLPEGSPAPRALEHQALRWLPAAGLAEAVPWAPADIPLLAAVQAVMEGQRR